MIPDDPIPHSSSLAFLSDGSELGALVRAFDWTGTALGPAEHWSSTLKTTVGIVLRSPVAMAVLWGENGIMIYNEAYAAFARNRHPMLLGAEARMSWPEIVDFNDNIMKVGLAGGSLSYTDQEMTLNRNGTLEQIWLNLDCMPVVDESGKPAGVLAVVVETTERVLSERSVRAERERLELLFAQAPGFMAVLEGHDHVFELVNPAYEQLIGHRKVEGKPVCAALPEVVGQGFIALLDQVYQSGQAYTGTSVKVGLQRTPDADVEERYVDFVFQPIVGAEGNVSGIFVEGYDVTKRVHGEAHLRLLMNELNHRLKNTLATVQAIIRQTLPSSGPVKDVRDAISARITALSRAQDVLTNDHWRSADIRQVVAAAITPHSGDDHPRFRVDGPSVSLNTRAVLSLSLALHELATNAAKYGALSTQAGQVEISWSVERNPEPRLYLEWRERGGPPVEVPSREGFGTQLIKRGLAMELDADVALDYPPSGFVFKFRTALAFLAEQTDDVPS